MHELDHQSQLSGFQILRRKKGKNEGGGKIFREKKGLRRTFTRCIKGTPRTLVPLYLFAFVILSSIFHIKIDMKLFTLPAVMQLFYIQSLQNHHPQCMVILLFPCHYK